VQEKISASSLSKVSCLLHFFVLIDFMADWSETKSILLELEQLFKRDDDVRDIEDIKKMATEIEFQRTQHTRDLKAIIKRK
jgi:hypothetical protein